MTQEDKELLLKDLCARLPYKTWVQYEGKEWLVTGYGHGRVSLLPNMFSSATGPCPLIEDIKPYLRPMSSMTEEERKRYKSFFSIGEYSCGGSLDGEEYEYIDSDSDNIGQCISLIDWLNAHHFDYRGLILMGLALEAPEGMYKIE